MPHTWTFQYPSPLGIIELACSDIGVRTIRLPAAKAAPRTSDGNFPITGKTPTGLRAKKSDPTRALRLWLDDYFAGKIPDPSSLPLDIEGSTFQKRVWKKLIQQEYASLITYGELAASINCGSSRAVGQAVGRNPLPILIPCHRVIAADRRLGGFSSGIDLKIRLLKHEGISVDPHKGRILP